MHDEEDVANQQQVIVTVESHPMSVEMHSGTGLHSGTKMH